MLYAACSAGILRSRDEGAVWNIVTTQLVGSLTPTTLRVCPAEPDHVLLGAAFGGQERYPGVVRDRAQPPDTRVELQLAVEVRDREVYMAEMKLLDVERRLERVERLLRAAADEARSARIDLGLDVGGNERWAKMMFAVRAEGG